MKAKRKINLVDIIILVALLCITGALVLGLVRGLGTSGEKVTLRYVLEVDPIDSEFAAKVAEDDGVYDHATSQRIGTVIAVASSQAYHTGYDSKGTSVSSPIEGSSVLHITIEAEASRSDTGFVIGNSVIGVGRDLEIRLPGLYCVGECVKAEIIEE